MNTICTICSIYRICTLCIHVPAVTMSNFVWCRNVHSHFARLERVPSGSNLVTSRCVSCQPATERPHFGASVICVRGFYRKEVCNTPRHDDDDMPRLTVPSEMNQNRIQLRVRICKSHQHTSECGLFSI